MLVLSGQICPCPEGGCPWGCPPFTCETLPFCIHLHPFDLPLEAAHIIHIIRILDCFFCLCVFSFRTITFFFYIFCNFCLSSRNILQRCDFQLVCHCGQLNVEVELFHITCKFWCECRTRRVWNSIERGRTVLFISAPRVHINKWNHTAPPVEDRNECVHVLLRCMLSWRGQEGLFEIICNL